MTGASRSRGEPVDACPEGGHDVRRNRFLTASVAGGFDGVMHVAMMLRTRQYQVTKLSVDVGCSSTRSAVRVTVRLTSAEARLLLERMRRLPLVVTAQVEP